MAQNSKSEKTWNAVRRRVFQEMDLPREAWLKVILDKDHPLFQRYTAQSVSRLRAIEFVQAFGSTFPKAWPSIRQAIVDANKTSSAVLNGLAGIDAIWGKLVMGDVFAKVPKPGFNITRKDVGVYRVIAKAGRAMTAYEVAKVTGRDYRRVHDNYSRLVNSGILEAKEITEPRRKVVAFTR